MTTQRKNLGLVIGLLVGVGLLSLAIVMAISTIVNQHGVQCSQKKPTAHTITIQGDNVQPATIRARQCDSLTITNKDDKTRLIAFGTHDDHIPYAGVSEKVLYKDQSFTIKLQQIGNFIVHDHLHAQAQATFTVN